MLPGDKAGYWGPVTGFDFCERNYAVTYYVGELACMLTNFISIPLYAAMIAFVWHKGSRMTALTYIYIFVAFLDMFFAGMSHGTLIMNWTRAQEYSLDSLYILFFLVMYFRYDGDKICKFIILITTGARAINGIIDVAEQGLASKFAGASKITDFTGNAVNILSLVSILALAGQRIRGREILDFTCRLLIAGLFFLVPAFVIFGITEVHKGNCLKLPVWLHPLAHLLGAVSDYFSLLVVVALDAEVKKSMTMGLKFSCIPGLFTSRSVESFLPYL